MTLDLTQGISKSSCLWHDGVPPKRCLGGPQRLVVTLDTGLVTSEGKRSRTGEFAVWNVVMDQSLLSMFTIKYKHG